jgi:thioredoxin-like negative regulator of GroEL
MPCRVYKKTFEKVTALHPVTATEVDIDEQPALKEQFQVHKIPTTVLLVDGVEVSRHEGAMLYRDLTAMIEGATT